MALISENRFKAVLFIFGLLFFLPSQWACEHPKSNVTVEGEAKKNKTSDGKEEKKPAYNVDLPEPPPSSGFVIQEKNEDGTLRIAGLVENQKKYLEKPISVRGVLLYISPKCDPKKAKKQNKPCPEPHMAIRDDKEGEKQLLIVGYPEEFIKKSKLQMGEYYTFKGTYRLVTQGFAATEDGLLLLDEANEIAVIEKK